MPPRVRFPAGQCETDSARHRFRADEPDERSRMSGLQQSLKLVSITALNEKAVGILSGGVGDAPGGHPLSPETPRHPLSSPFAALVGVRVESQIDGPLAVAQLLKLSCVEMIAHEAGHIVESGLP